MIKESYSFMAIDTWDLIPLPKGIILVVCKREYKTKYGQNGSLDKHKARLFSKGFLQVEGIVYT